MTIGPFLQNKAFEPEDVEAMSAALEDAADATGPRELIADQIIAVAHSGERSPTALRDRVLREFSAFDAQGVRRLVRAYRVFPVSPEGHISGPATVVECADDEEAIRVAWRARENAEIWEGARLVARLEWLQSPEERIGGT